MAKKSIARTTTTKKILRRKPMTPEQKAAAVERLRVAREKRLKENPPQYKNVHQTVKSLPDDDKFSLKNVRQWIKTQKVYLHLRDKKNLNLRCQVSEDTFVIVKITYDTALGLI